MRKIYLAQKKVKESIRKHPEHKTSLKRNPTTMTKSLTFFYF